MIHEIVSSFIAGILKEKGFNAPCLCRYIYDVPVENTRTELQGYYCNHNLTDGVVAAPTYQQVTDWLRDEHNLSIYTFPLSPDRSKDGKNWEAGICYCDDGTDATINACEHIYGETYYKCVEAAIMYCLVHDFLQPSD